MPVVRTVAVVGRFAVLEGSAGLSAIVPGERVKPGAVVAAVLVATTELIPVDSDFRQAEYIPETAAASDVCTLTLM